MRHLNHRGRMGLQYSQRLNLLRNLAKGLIESGRIRTTDSKAKFLRSFIEKLITLGRDGSTHNRRQAFALLPQKEAIKKLFAEIGPRFVDRPGGYTRVIKEGVRPGDGASMSYIEFVDFAPAPPKKKLTDREKRLRKLRRG
ncbi:MAG: 50S ribosomal protein L17 [Candidatus Sumerlaeota bacterium]|nr:50S ribosomal protein L17 [Candidatus Sumerlaeota bacterium]